MRDYIHRHQSEFVPEGVDPAVVEATETLAVAESPGVLSATEMSEEQARKSREHERNQRGLQWAYDTIEGTLKVAKQSTEGALELIRDAWDQSSSTTVLYFAIVFLVISNVWTLMMMGRREEAGRRKEIKRTEDREKWVQDVVSTLWDELNMNKASTGGWPGVRSGPDDIKGEIVEISNVLDRVEERIQTLRKSLQELD